MVTTTQKQAALGVLKAVLDAVKESGERGIPSGHLYAAVMGMMPLEVYSNIIASAKAAGLVKEQYNVLYWTGPKA